MSHLVEREEMLSRPGLVHEELIFPCDCGDGDYLRITWDTDPEWRYLWVEAHHYRRTVPKRIVAAFRVLIGRSWQHSEIILDLASVAALRDFFGAGGEHQ